MTMTKLTGKRKLQRLAINTFMRVMLIVVVLAAVLALVSLTLGITGRGPLLVRLLFVNTTYINNASSVTSRSPATLVSIESDW